MATDHGALSGRRRAARRPATVGERRTCGHNRDPLAAGEGRMADLKESRVPDIGGYDDVPVIEVLVAVGDTVAQDQGLVTLESDKATMEVPSAYAGVVKELKVKVGDTLSEGGVVAVIETADGDAGDKGEDKADAKPAPAPAAAAPAPSRSKEPDPVVEPVAVGDRP